MVSPLFGLTELEEGQESAEVSANESLRRVEALAQIRVVDRDLSAAPALTPVTDDGKVYFVKATPGGGDAWEGQSNKLAIYNSGWTFADILTGWPLFILDEQIVVFWDGAAFVHLNAWRITTGISAAGTTEGAATQLNFGLSVVSTITAASAEAVKLPAAEKGARVVVVNRDGTDTLKLFPKSGDQLDGGTGSVDVAAGKSIVCHAIDATDWYSVRSA